MSAAASLRTPGRRAAALGLACALVAALASRAAADTASELAGAKATSVVRDMSSPPRAASTRLIENMVTSGSCATAPLP